jgi:hypothetical protein
MALIRVDAPGSTPSGLSDWTNIRAQVSQLLLNLEAPSRILGSNVLRGALFNIGGAMYVADADTAISGTASDYVRITPSGATAAAEFVANLTGVAWNAAYRGYYDASGNLYEFDEMRAILAGALAAPSRESVGMRYFATDAVRMILGYTGAGEYIIPGCHDPAQRSVYALAKMAEIKCPSAGTFRVKFRQVTDEGTSSGRVYKNGEAFGTARTGSGLFSEDLAFARGDLVQLFASASASSYVKDFALCGNGFGVLYL